MTGLNAPVFAFYLVTRALLCITPHYYVVLVHDHRLHVINVLYLFDILQVLQ